ncbi:MAG: GNAT family N-acetyltransferase [Ruminococcaceae bacterium]|nr:GNAT family N-acetyltransferase [Oscillospiraceae bacterium]
MNIEVATYERVSEILEIYAAARAYMRENGNMEQWAGNYPSRETVLSDIDAGHLYLCTEEKEIYGVFCYFEGEDPTYREIFDGAWRNDLPYGVMHRVAVAKHQRGVASFCFSYCYDRCRNLKIDTHKDNIPMQRALEKNGFDKCGTIYLESGDPRIAYQRCE